MKIVLASNNAGKLREFSAVLNPVGITMVAQKEVGVTAIEEPFTTFVENALAKARHAAQCTGLPALADDSGLCVPALQNAPGVYSARYAARAGKEHSDAANNQHLLAELQQVSNRQAAYVAVLVFLETPDDARPIIVEASWEGEISKQPKGQHGFGYDPYFYLPHLGKTAAELTPEQKNRYSHRGRALALLLDQLRERYDGKF